MYDENIDTFIGVSECGSLLKTAEKLYLSPNAVKKRIDRIEERIGAPLFLRSPKGNDINSGRKELLYQLQKA